MKPTRITLLILALALPAKAFACAACYGKVDSPLADGMNLGILTLLCILLPVLGCFLFGIIHLIRKGEAAQAAGQDQPTDP